jgi:hypothetical protein
VKRHTHGIWRGAIESNRGTVANVSFNQCLNLIVVGGVTSQWNVIQRTLSSSDKFELVTQVNIYIVNLETSHSWRISDLIIQMFVRSLILPDQNRRNRRWSSAAQHNCSKRGCTCRHSDTQVNLCVKCRFYNPNTEIKPLITWRIRHPRYLMDVGISAKNPWLTINANHSNVGCYRRPTSLTVKQKDVTLGLHPVGPSSTHGRTSSTIVGPQTQSKTTILQTSIIIMYLHVTLNNNYVFIW